MRFPREVWVGSNYSKSNHFPRQIVNDKDEFAEFVRQHNNRMNCYTSVYDYRRFKPKFKNGLNISEADVSSVILDRIFLDFDSHGLPLEESFKDLKFAVEFMLEHDYEFNMLFSGKGFHMYAYGKITNSIRNIQSFFREVEFYCKKRRGNDLIKSRTGTTLDSAGVRSRQLRRIANTVNMSSEHCYYCIPLLLEDLSSLENILETARKPRRIAREIYGSKKVEWPDLPPIPDAPIEDAVIERVGDLPIIPCLKNSIMVENPTHEARVYTVSWYRDVLALGQRHVSVNDQAVILNSIMAELENIAGRENVWLDWDEETTRFHTRYIVEGGYHAPSCGTLISKGYCTAKCWRYAN